jgi:hypothetical protein
MYACHLVMQKDFNLLDQPFKTNNKAIATKRGANFNKSTTWSHIKRLTEAGIIINKIWHGSKNSYELEFDSEILVAKECPKFTRILLELHALNQGIDFNEIKIEEKIEIALLKPIFADSKYGYLIVKYNHKETGTIQEHNYNKTKGIVNLASFLRANLASDESQINNGLSNKVQEHTDKSVLINFKEHQECGRQDQIPPAPLVNKSNDGAEINSIVSIAWSFAKSILWQSDVIEKHDELSAKEFIKLWFTGSLRKNTHATEGKLLQRFFERVQLSRRYVKKEPDRFIPNPRIYFDPEFAHGFAGTKEWVWKNQITKNELRDLNIATSSLRKALKYYFSDSNTASFKKCEQHLAKLKKPEILKTFYECAIDPKLFTHKTFKKLKKTKI